MRQFVTNLTVTYDTFDPTFSERVGVSVTHDTASHSDFLGSPRGACLWHRCVLAVSVGREPKQSNLRQKSPGPINLRPARVSWWGRVSCLLKLRTARRLFNVARWWPAISMRTLSINTQHDQAIQLGLVGS